MDYKNGKIYKITSDSCNKIYIGSTCQPLYKRLGQHKTAYKCFLGGKQQHKTSSFELIKLDDAIITLIEDYPCERKEQLCSRERYYIELNKDICINKQIPTRTRKECKKAYRESNKELIREQSKNYNETNKEIIAEKAKKYRETNKEKFIEYRKKYYETNKAIIAEKAKKNRETKKHIEIINQ
jgi:hypothetical protein